MQGDSWRGVRCGRFVSCREVRTGHLCGVGSSCRKWSVAASGHRGRSAQRVGAHQTARFGGRHRVSGWPPATRLGAYKGRSGSVRSLSLSLSAALPRFSLNLNLDSAFCRHHWALPPRLHPHDSDSTLPTQTPTSCPRSRLELPEAGDDAPATRGVRRHRAFPPNVLEARSGTAYHLYKGTERP